MKNAAIFGQLNEEHRAAIDFANRMLALLDGEDPAGLETALRQTLDYCQAELEAHLHHEEMTIFAPLFQEYKAHVELTRRLLHEHGEMRALARTLDETAPAGEVRRFLQLLRDHSQTEEEILQAAIAELFTPAQIEAIQTFVPPQKQAKAAVSSC